MAEKINNENEKEEKNKKGVIIGVLGLAAAAAVAVPFALKGCAPELGDRSFTVTFLTDDEVQNFEEKNVNVKDGTRVGDLKDQLAPLDGYDFGGFFKDETCTEEFDDNEIVNDDTKIYIKYTEIQITLIFHGEKNTDKEGDEYPTVVVGYYDKISDYLDKIPVRSKTREGYIDTFKCWETLDNKEVYFDKLKNVNGGELLAIDADRMIDLYEKYNSVQIEYSITIADGINVKRGNENITNTSILHLGDKLTITYTERDGYITEFKYSGLEKIGDTEYSVTGDVNLELIETATLVEIGEIPRGITVYLGESATGTKLKEGDKVDYDSKITVHYDCDEGYRLSSLIINNTKYTSSNNNITIVIKSKLTITFNQEQYIFTISFNEREVLVKDASGNSLSSGVSKVEEGQLISIEAVVEGDWICYTTSVIGATFTSGKNYKVTDNVIINSNVYHRYLGFVSVDGGYNVIGVSNFSVTETNIVIPAYHYNGLPIIGIEDGFSSTSGAFYLYRNQITSVTINVQKIGDYAFSGFSKLTTVKIGENVTNIGKGAFVSCSNLTTVNIGENVTSIGISAFSGCSSLRSIEIPDNVKSLGKSAFMDCTNLASVKFGNGLETIGGWAFFQCYGLTSIVIPDSVTVIEEVAFSSCTALRSIVIGKNVKAIELGTFSGCIALTSIVIPKSVTKIVNQAFEGCSSLNEVYYMGTAEDWDNINIDTLANNALISAQKYYFSEENPYTNGTAKDGEQYWHWTDVDGVQTPTVWTKED